jgi:hypothetical protein
MAINVVWSSQLTGFATGQLVDPAPKVLMPLVRFNLLVEDGKLPGSISTLWADKQPMVDTTGKSLAPAVMILVFTGEIDMQLPEALESPWSWRKGSPRQGLSCPVLTT